MHIETADNGKFGEVVTTKYSVFPGIDLVYNDVHCDNCSTTTENPDHGFQINHCCQGRIEVGFDCEYVYLEPGDMAIGRRNQLCHQSYFPTGHYHGITILIDLDKVPKCLSCFLEDVNVNPSALIQKFCPNTNCYVLRANQRIEHVFSELYSVRDNIRKGYFKIKVLELFLFLSGLDVDSNATQQRLYLPSQVLLAKDISQFIASHLEEKITIDQLAGLFCVSSTHLKNCFKGVYGMPVYAYIRTQKMNGAAKLLRETDQSVLCIAGKYGYENGSKFAQAFKAVMGVTPNQYRNSAHG